MKVYIITQKLCQVKLICRNVTFFYIVLVVLQIGIACLQILNILVHPVGKSK